MFLSPDCREGKHRACHGDAWNFHDDAPIDCGCGCHQGVGLVKPAEDAFGITHGVTVEQAVGLAASLIQTTVEAEATVRRLRKATGGSVVSDPIVSAVNARLAYDANHNLAGSWLDAENKLTDTQFMTYQQMYQQRAMTQR